MVILGSVNGRPVVISLKPHSLTVSIDGPHEADVVSFDREGRLWTAFFDSVSYRRGLDGKMVAKWRTPGKKRDRRWLPPDEALTVEAQARALAALVYEGFTGESGEFNQPLPPEGGAAFKSAIAFDEPRSLADARRYAEVYLPVGILPPDQYMAVVLQLTEGCSFNACTFCSFYRGRRFHIKSPDEFHAHAQAVRDFLGAGLNLRQTIFLGDANSLVVPTKMLLPLLDVVHEIYDVEALGGMYAFLDAFSGDKKSAAEYVQLRERGMRRVYIGLESGSAELLRFLNKPGEPHDAVQAVRAMKAGGLSVGVIVLLGAGGREYGAGHVRDTAAVLNALDLGMDDILYFSELMVGGDVPYAQDAVQAGLRPLTHEECVAQQAAIETQLSFSSSGGTPHISRYDIREFVY